MRLNEEQSFMDYVKMVVLHNGVALLAVVCIFFAFYLFAKESSFLGVIFIIIGIALGLYSRYLGSQRNKKKLW